MTTRPTEAEFDELKRQRDEGIMQIVREARAKLGGGETDAIHFHCPDFHADCYCACPEGPCQHEWGGWREFEDDSGGEQFCQRCGVGAMQHSMRTGP